MKRINLKKSATSFLSPLTYAVIFSYSLSGPLTHLLTHKWVGTYAPAHTQKHTQCGQLWSSETTPVDCSPVCQDNDSLCWKMLFIPSYVSLSLSPSECLCLRMSFAVLVFWRKMPITQIGCWWRKSESCSERRRVSEMKCWEIAVLSVPLLIKAL